MLTKSRWQWQTFWNLFFLTIGCSLNLLGLESVYRAFLRWGGNIDDPCRGGIVSLWKSRCYNVDKTIAYLLIWEIDLKCIKSFVEIFYCQITAQIYNKQLLLHVGLVVDKMWSVVVFSYQLVHLQAVLPCGLSFLRPSLRTFINLDHNPEVLWLFDTPSLSQAYICIIIHLESHAWWNWKHRTRYETQALADEFGIEGLLKLDEPVLEHRLKGWQFSISR